MHNHAYTFILAFFKKLFSMHDTSYAMRYIIQCIKVVGAPICNEKKKSTREIFYHEVELTELKRVIENWARMVTIRTSLTEIQNGNSDCESRFEFVMAEWAALILCY